MDFGFVATPPSKNRPLERPSSAREVKKARSFEWRVASRCRLGRDPCRKGVKGAILIDFGTHVHDLRRVLGGILGLNHPHAHIFIDFATRFMLLKVEYSMDFGFVATPHPLDPGLTSSKNRPPKTSQNLPKPLKTPKTSHCLIKFRSLFRSHFLNPFGGFIGPSWPPEVPT